MSAPLTARCERCPKPVTHGDGGVWATFADINRYPQLVQEWKQAHQGEVLSLGDLMAHPRGIHWWITHWRCRTPDEVDAYWFELPRTHAAWLEWAAHLIEKNWVADSDLSGLLREIARSERRFAA